MVPQPLIATNGSPDTFNQYLGTSAPLPRVSRNLEESPALIYSPHPMLVVRARCYRPLMNRKKHSSNRKSHSRNQLEPGRKRPVRAGVDQSAVINQRLTTPHDADPGSETAGQSGDLQGLSNAELADSESVVELVEEGQAFEAGVVSGVENAPDADQSEVKAREVPEEDVPPIPRRENE